MVLQVPSILLLMRNGICETDSGLLVGSSGLHLEGGLVSGIWGVLWYNMPIFLELEACREGSHSMGLALVGNK